MCHHHEARERAALREALEEAEDEAPEVDIDDGPDTGDRLPPIQPTD